MTVLRTATHLARSNRGAVRGEPCPAASEASLVGRNQQAAARRATGPYVGPEVRPC